jgi:hypothetical protein
MIKGKMAITMGTQVMGGRCPVCKYHCQKMVTDIWKQMTI